MEVTPELLAQMVADAVAAAKPKRKQAAGEKKARPKLTEEQKAANRAKNDAEAAKMFTAKGYKDVKPRVNVLTYDKWIENGRRVRKGEKSIKVGAFSLFHQSQTDAIAKLN